MATDLTPREATTAVGAHPSAPRAETVHTSSGSTRALGYWSALLASCLTVSFVALTIAFPAGEWRGIDLYARTFDAIQVAQLVPVLLLAPVVVVLMALFAGVSFPRAGPAGGIRRLFILTGVTGCLGAAAGLLDLRTAMLSGFGLSLAAFLVTVVLLCRHFERQGAA